MVSFISVANFVLMLLILWARLLGWRNVVRAVDRSNFKTCEQSAFCKRHRNIDNKDLSHPVFHIEADSVTLNGSRLEATLRRQSDQASFSLLLTGLSDSRLRVTVDEVDPIRQRFIPHDALTGEPSEQPFKTSSPGGGSYSLLTADRFSVILHYRPFRIDIYGSNQRLLLSINSQNLLKFEKFRKKPGATDQSAEKVQEDLEKEEWGEDPSTKDSETEDQNAKANETSDEGEGFWDEHWKSHFDSKPFGSSSVGLDISFVGFEHVYGLPEHSDSLALKSTLHTDPYRLYNLDVFEYEVQNGMALYGSIPYLMAHSSDHTISLLWLNSAETWVDIRSTTADKGMLRAFVDKFKASSEVPQINTHFISESGLVDLFIFLGPKPTDVFRQYTDLTGRTPLPPLFAIGYHQCRWNYNDQEDVRQVDAGFDEHDIPYDVLWLDIEHTDGKRYFTWDARKFPDSKAMLDSLAAKHRRMVTISDPHIKKDDDYKVYKQGKENDYFVKNKDGSVYEGWCWPGTATYMDFFNPAVRKFWANQYHLEEYVGTTESLFVWNDMNEPSVFNGPEVTMHKDCLHHGGWEHREVHNMYGFYNHMSTFKGLLERSQGRLRPFLLTRSFFVGSQRYGGVWTGDNSADWAHLQASLPMCLSLSLGGIPFIGADVGGFFRNPEEELLVRWYQTGIFYPFFRAHAHLDTRRREPWLFSQQTKLHIRDAIRLRYTLLPFWYWTFHEHETSGLPVMRPCWLEFPNDKNVLEEERQFMIGDSLLIRPVMDPGAHSVSVYLPGEDSIWYDFQTFKSSRGPGSIYVETPLSKIPVFVRGGKIIPLWSRVRRTSELMLNDPITLYVALNYPADFANGSLYLDDGKSYAYKQGKFIKRSFEYIAKNQVQASLSSKKSSEAQSLSSEVWIEKIIIVGLKMWPRDVHLFLDDYKPTPLKFDFSADTMTLVIRKPGMKIMSDWRIDIHA